MVRDALRTCDKICGMRRILPLAAVALIAGCTSYHSEPVIPLPTPPTAGPSKAADCPAPGLLITAERGDAAAGYREMTIKAKNCGDTPYVLDGRPDIVVLDADRKAAAVALVPSVHWTASPRKLTLQPGTSATAVLAWHNTVTESTVVATSGAYLDVAPGKGEPRQIVTPPVPLDLGNTGKLQASAWF